MSRLRRWFAAAFLIDGTPRSPRYRSLDLWRGVACLSVVLYHSVLLHLMLTPGASSSPARIALTWLSTLSAGVPMFFVISGYCIAAAADNVRLNGTSTATYFLRRFRRIYPPLWAAMVFGIICFILLDVLPPQPLLSTQPWIQPRPWWYSPSQWLGNITLTETWRHYVWGSPRAHFPGQAWTLCYEEQFYFLMGLLLAARRQLLRGVIVLTSGTLVTMAIAGRAGWSVDGVFVDGNWLTFAAGVFVYFALNYGALRHQVALGLALLAAIGAAGLQYFGTLGLGCGFAACLLVLRRWDSRIVSARLAQPLMWCGRMCYSLYLVHQIPVRAVAAATHEAGLRSDLATLAITVPACVAVSLVLAAAFHHVVERRFLNAPTTKPAAVRAVLA